MSVLTDLKNRGMRGVFFVGCDELKGLPDVVANGWPSAIVQTYIIRLIRNTFRLTSPASTAASPRPQADLHRGHRDRRLGSVRRARRDLGAAPPSEDPASAHRRTWRPSRDGPMAGSLGDNPWNEFIPFLDYDIEIRRVLCSTNAFQSLNACPRRAATSPPSRRRSS
jgi:transposase-like protein